MRDRRADDDAAGRGRACPAWYRSRPEDLAAPAGLSCHTAYVVGGLYGNEFALRAVLERAADEIRAPAIVFNGDFHYLDADRRTFESINEEVLSHHATVGNIEAQLAEDGAGCGCAYPEYVDDATVARSDRIVARPREVAGRCPGQVDRPGVVAAAADDRGRRRAGRDRPR